MPSKKKIYSPSSPALQSTLERHNLSNNLLPSNIHDQQQALYLQHDQSSKSFHSISHHQEINQETSQCTSQCLRFRYFTIFLICTTCLALLSASLATHKWIVSKPIRMLKLNNSQTNWTSLMLIASQNDYPTTSQQHQQQTYRQQNYHHNNKQSIQASLSLPESNQFRHNNINSNPNSLMAYLEDSNNVEQDGSGTNNVFLGGPGAGLNSNNGIEKLHNSGQNKKFQGEIYFGLFRGLKILNHGFGDRQTLISVSAPFTKENAQQQELVDFRLWLLTLTSVSLAILFALIGSIFAIINFVMSPRGTLTGPIGLVIWNATACFACLVATLAWLTEFFLHLQANVLTPEEVQNGWTSESRSQFGYSYYLVISALLLHLVNIFIVSIVQFESWSKSSKASKRLARPVCEGVTMLY